MKEVLLSEIDWLTPKNVTTLKKNNITTVEDLLTYFPNKFDNYTIISYFNAPSDTNVTVEGVVQSKPMVMNVKTKLSMMNFYTDINGHRVKVTIFNRHFLKTKLGYGVYVRLTGKFNAAKNNFTASEINFDEFSNAFNPVYNIKGITDEKMLDIKKKVFNEYSYLIEENLPEDIRNKYQLIDYSRALQYMNFPENIEDVKAALKRIKFEELFMYQLRVKYMFYMRKKYPMGISINFDKNKVNRFIDSLPFRLTADQEKSVKEILEDIKAPYQMNRLLQGEVGSGKTIVAAICLYAVVTSGYQGAIMVPTEVLAKQHYQTFTKLFENIDLKVGMLVASISTKERKDTLDALKNKEVDIVIGTHSLFQKDVEFVNLGLVVTDEEHRFGVKQRVSILGKGHLIDHLKMSATPIPRTLAISYLGDSDFSVIKTLPGNKKDVVTKYVEYAARKPIFEHIKEELERGRQIYIITPMIEDSDVMNLNNAQEVYEHTKKYYQGLANVGLIHSRLKTEEKEDVMSRFEKNELQILVSTSVIEVGVNIVNATTIIILDADRFGIAQLHQMRGRVRRSDYQAYCFLVSASTAESAISRLKKVEENSDGFTLAEEDLLVRGPGDFFSEKQSGNVLFKVADIVEDKDILEIVNIEAEEVVKSEKIFTESYKKLYNIIDENYQSKKDLLN